ncbi:hypothetical protein MHB84_22975 [Paenibacillus sp. FSL F4-0087]|uniref:hypothetical protein n=1 Tax=Paenibacillus sp. FSL F4-0087 TaxID=2921368 RepID=UPI00096D8518|nr:hypothetical protein BK122_27495 [Paenibacillus pabuli]
MFEEFSGLFTTISGLSTVTTLVTSGIALFTLKEMSKQRKSTFKPDVVLSSSNNVYLTSEGNRFTNFNVRTSREKDVSEELAILSSRQVPIKIFNLGKGAAKDVEIKWCYDIDLLISKIHIEVAHIQNNEKIPMLSYVESGLLSGVINKQIDAIQMHDYILPVETSSNTVYCALPMGFVLLCYLGTISFIRQQVNNSFEGQYIPKIELEISYSDIGREKHKKKYIGEFIFNYGEHDLSKREVDLACQVDFHLS